MPSSPPSATPAHLRQQRASTASLPLREVARFSADGKQGNLNRYLILQRL